jgi:hypothetical protein
MENHFSLEENNAILLHLELRTLSDTYSHILVTKILKSYFIPH